MQCVVGDGDGGGERRGWGMRGCVQQTHHFLRDRAPEEGGVLQRRQLIGACTVATCLTLIGAHLTCKRIFSLRFNLGSRFLRYQVCYAVVWKCGMEGE